MWNEVNAWFGCEFVRMINCHGVNFTEANCLRGHTILNLMKSWFYSLTFKTQYLELNWPYACGFQFICWYQGATVINYVLVLFSASSSSYSNFPTLMRKTYSNTYKANITKDVFCKSKLGYGNRKHENKKIWKQDWSLFVTHST